MSDTPRTDALATAYYLEDDAVLPWEACRIFELELNAANAEIKRLKNITASGIHTCSEQCKRPMCVMRRQLRDANAKITELEEQLENLKPSDFDPFDPV